MSKLDVFPNSETLKLHPLDHLIHLLYHLHHSFQLLHHLMSNYQIIHPPHHSLRLQHMLLRQLDLVVQAAAAVVVPVEVEADGDWGWIHRMKWTQRWIQQVLRSLLNCN